MSQKTIKEIQKAIDKADFAIKTCDAVNHALVNIPPPFNLLAAATIIKAYEYGAFSSVK